MNKEKLILKLNKTVADIKRGEKAFNELAEEIRELNQISMIDDIYKKDKLKDLINKKAIFLDCISKLENKYSLIATELEENHKVKIEADHFIYGINIFEYIPNFKII